MTAQRLETCHSFSRSRLQRLTNNGTPFALHFDAGKAPAGMIHQAKSSTRGCGENVSLRFYLPRLLVLIPRARQAKYKKFSY